MTTAAELVLVSAGRSSRMGFPKALARVDGRPLIEWHFKHSTSAGIGKLILVLGYHEARIVHEIRRRGLLEKYPLRLVRNPDPKGDMFSSVKRGLKQHDGFSPVFFLPVDTPVCSPDTYQQLLDADSDDSVLVPTFEGKRGHPPLFQPEFVERLRNATPAEGIRSLYQNEDITISDVPTNDPSVLFDLDTPADLREFRAHTKGHTKL